MTGADALEQRRGSLPSPYEFKGSPYSSHSRLLEAFPARGDGRAVIEADLNRELPELENGCSHALCGDVLEHLVDPGETLRWLAATLAPDGRLVASLPNSAHWFVRLNVLMGRFPEDDKGLFDRTHLHFYAWRNWKSLLERSGFVVESVTPTVIPFDLALPRLGRGLIVRMLEAVNFALAKVGRDLWAYQLVVVARKAGH